MHIIARVYTLTHAKPVVLTRVLFSVVIGGAEILEVRNSAVPSGEVRKIVGDGVGYKTHGVLMREVVGDCVGSETQGNIASKIIQMIIQALNIEYFLEV